VDGPAVSLSLASADPVTETSQNETASRIEIGTVFIAKDNFWQTKVDFHSIICHRLVLASENDLLCDL
jgi:hypothetical protein